MTILQIFSLAYPLYDPARGDFDDADFPLEFGVPQVTVNASSPLKQGDVLLEQGVADMRALLARAMEERFLHNYAYKSRADERSWCVYSFPIPHKYKCMNALPCASCSFSLAFSLVCICFVACTPSPPKKMRYTISFCDEKY